MNILDQILAYKKQEIEVRKLFVPEKELLKSIFFNRTCLSMKEALLQKGSSGIIAEFKRRSPSKGIINNVSDVKKVCTGYTKAGAAALSVLTDTHFFGGSSADLVAARRNQIPILRKDFMIDPYDLLVAKAIGADAVLLIAACLTKTKVRKFSAMAKQLGMEVLLEIHNEKELDQLCDEVDMVGINNRDLRNFKTDISLAIALGKKLPKEMVRIAESGIQDTATVKRLQKAGFKGFLIGERFMREKDPAKALATFAENL